MSDLQGLLEEPTLPLGSHHTEELLSSKALWTKLRSLLAAEYGDAESKSLVNIMRKMAHFRYFRFLDLPPELRNKIYEYAMLDEFSWFSEWPPEVPLPTLPKESYTVGRIPAIARACRLTRLEMLPMWYAEVRLVIRVDNNTDRHAFEDWLTHMRDDHVSAIRYLRFQGRCGTLKLDLSSRTTELSTHSLGLFEINTSAFDTVSFRSRADEVIQQVNSVRHPEMTADGKFNKDGLKTLAEPFMGWLRTYGKHKTEDDEAREMEEKAQEEQER